MSYINPETKMKDIVEEAESCLVLSQFTRAEELSRKALKELQTAGQSPSPLLKRSCSICIQALFELGRYAA